MKSIKIRCAFCHDVFLRSRGQLNEAKKFGWKQFCSRKCMAKSRFTGKELVCANRRCCKVFYRPLKEIKKVQQSFCSHACAATINNKLRAEDRPIIFCSYADCKLEIPRDRKYCSQIHSSLARRISIDVFKKQFTGKIKAFYDKYGRIPVKREMYGAYREAREFFGSWNRAIEVAGFTPNPVMFAKKYLAKDGHPCDSLAEKVIDDWFYDKNIKHERNIKYPGNPRLTADFRTKRHWIEFFGLMGEIKEYDILMRKKQKLAKKYKLPFVAIYPKDIFPINNLEKILHL